MPEIRAPGGQVNLSCLPWDFVFLLSFSPTAAMGFVPTDVRKVLEGLR